MFSGAYKTGRDVYVERDLPEVANHRLSTRNRKVRSRKVFAAALRCAVPALRKPGASVRGCPSNACVRPRDGFTAVRKPNAAPRPSRRPGKQVTLRARNAISQLGPGQLRCHAGISPQCGPSPIQKNIVPAMRGFSPRLTHFHMRTQYSRMRLTLKGTKTCANDLQIFWSDR